jgi:ATP-dependent helicase HrpB
LRASRGSIRVAESAPCLLKKSAALPRSNGPVAPDGRRQAIACAFGQSANISIARRRITRGKTADLAEVVLTLKASGVEEIGSFRWPEPPDPQALRARNNSSSISGHFMRHRLIRKLEAHATSRHLDGECWPFGPSALCADASGGATVSLCARRRIDRGAHARPQPLRAAPGKQAREDREDVLGGAADWTFSF